MIVKVRIFSRTERVTGAVTSDTMIQNVVDEVNPFLATFSINNILDVRESWASAGKYSEFSVFQITVYYLE